MISRNTNLTDLRLPKYQREEIKTLIKSSQKTILEIYCQKILTFFFLPLQFSPQRKRSGKNQQFQAKRKKTANRKAESPPRSKKDSHKPPPRLPSPILRPTQDGLRRFLHTIIADRSCGSHARDSVTSAYDLRRPHIPTAQGVREEEGQGTGRRKAGGGGAEEQEEVVQVREKEGPSLCTLFL